MIQRREYSLPKSELVAQKTKQKKYFKETYKVTEIIRGKSQILGWLSRKSNRQAPQRKVLQKKKKEQMDKRILLTTRKKFLQVEEDRNL